MVKMFCLKCLAFKLVRPKQIEIKSPATGKKRKVYKSKCPACRTTMFGRV